MPTRLTRYLLAEIFTVFLVALTTLTALILLIGVGRTLLRAGLGPAAIAQLLPYVLPISLQFALPATALFAICSVYGRISADGEISTIKAVGVSPLKVLRPAIFFGLLLSPITVWLSDLAVSWGQPGLNRVVFFSLEDVVYRALRAQHSYSSPKGFSIHVQDVDGRRLIYPTVTIHPSSTMKPLIWTAREGSIGLDAEREMLTISFIESQLRTPEGSVHGKMDSTVIEVPLGKVLAKGDVSSSRPSTLPLRDIPSETENQQQRITAAQQELAAQAGLSMAFGSWHDFASAEGPQLAAKVSAAEVRLTRLGVEPWRRWAGGFSCFCFVAVGAPLAIRLRNADYWTSFGMCFLPILLLYYPLFAFGLEKAKDGSFPPISVWLGNVALLGVAAIFTRHVWRY